MSVTIGHVLVAVVVAVWLLVFYLAWSFSRAASTSEQDPEHSND